MEWEQPNTVILLLACGSSTTDVTTLNDIVTSLASAGAGAVIGTESPVFPRLVCRFGREVTQDLFAGRNLGVAVTDFHRRLLRSGNPLAFAFTCIGSLELELAR